MSKDRKDLQRMLQERAYLRGDFRLASGTTSDHYFDAKLVTLDPQGMTLVGKVFFGLIESYSVEAVGGQTTGADPIASAIARYAWSLGIRLPAFVVRKEPKKHGLNKFIEGPLLPRSRVAVVDDVITSGQSVLRAVEILENQLSCSVAVIAALVDRGEGGRENIERSGYEFKALFTADQVVPPLTALHASA